MLLKELTIPNQILSKALNDDNLDKYHIEPINENLVNGYVGDIYKNPCCYNKYYIIKDSNNNESILRISFNKENTCYDANLLLPFKKYEFEILPKGARPFLQAYITIKSDNGLNIYSLYENKFILKEEDNLNIVSAELCDIAYRPAFILKDKTEKKGLFFSKDDPSNIPIDYEEINISKNFNFNSNPHITIASSNDLEKRVVFTKKDGKVGLFYYHFKKTNFKKINLKNPPLDKIIKIPNSFHKIEYFGGGSLFNLFKVTIEQSTNVYKVGILDIDKRQFVVPPIFDDVDFYKFDNCYSIDNNNYKYYLGRVENQQYIIDLEKFRIYKQELIDLSLDLTKDNQGLEEGIKSARRLSRRLED